MMKSRLFLLLWMCCSVLLTACENEDPIPEPPVAGSRTVLAYLAADHRGTLNNLSSLALLDLEEMRLGMAKVNNSSNMRLLVYIDTDSSRRSLKVPWNNPILAKDSTYPIQEEWNISNAM